MTESDIYQLIGEAYCNGMVHGMEKAAGHSGSGKREKAMSRIGGGASKGERGFFDLMRDYQHLHTAPLNGSAATAKAVEQAAPEVKALLGLPAPAATEALEAASKAGGDVGLLNIMKGVAAKGGPAAAAEVTSLVPNMTTALGPVKAEGLLSKLKGKYGIAAGLLGLGGLGAAGYALGNDAHKEKIERGIFGEGGLDGAKDRFVNSRAIWGSGGLEGAKERLAGLFS